MIFAKKDAAPPSTTATAPAGDSIFDANMADFETRVLQASLDIPILVDFWSPRSPTCKQMIPVLEAAVMATNGKVRLAKVNIDENPQLAQALRVQSVPTVYAFYHGQPVNAFTGPKTTTDLKTFIDQLLRLAQNAQPNALDVPAVLKQAALALSGGDLATAQDLYAAILGQDDKNTGAYVGLVRTYIAAGQLDEAQQFIDSVPPEVAKDASFTAAKTALELARNAPQGDAQKLQAILEKNPADLQTRFDLALILFAAGQKSDAMDQLVDIIRRNRAWEDDKARKKLLEFFDALGPADPETLAGRRKLSSVLFS